jgi:hypothetical protein
VGVHQALAAKVENVGGVKAESSGMEAVGGDLCQLALVWTIGLQKTLAWQTIADMLRTFVKSRGATSQHPQDNFHAHATVQYHNASNSTPYQAPETLSALSQLGQKEHPKVVQQRNHKAHSSSSVHQGGFVPKRHQQLGCSARKDYRS